MSEIGQVVRYQTDGRNGLEYFLPAVIVRNQQSSDPRSPLHVLKVDEVDLFVMSVDGAHYGENAVPYGPAYEPRTWRFG